MKRAERANQLAELIKAHHETLREVFQQNTERSQSETWKAHVDSRSISKDYSDWMKELGSVHWSQKSQNEIIASYIVLYYEGQEQGNVLRKLERKAQIPVGSLPLTPRESYLQVLDVGSCYNPFKSLALERNWKLTALDLFGSLSDDVYSCDFLTVPIGSSFFSENNVITVLPASYFDVVLFSLLLEYIPNSQLRFKAVVQAKATLKTHGLLIIISPDSSHQNKNSHQMKAWKRSLAFLGLYRIYYRKLPHVHMSVFVKLNEEKCSDFISSHYEITASRHTLKQSPEDLLFIPQDKKRK